MRGWPNTEQKAFDITFRTRQMSHMKMINLLLIPTQMQATRYSRDLHTPHAQAMLAI